MGLLKFLFYRKKKEEDLPLIAKVKFRKLEKEEIENYVNNLDSSILASRRYRAIMDENTETDNKSKVKNTIHNESEREL